MYWILDNNTVSIGLIASEAEVKKCQDLVPSYCNLTKVDNILHIQGTWIDELHDYNSFLEKYRV